LAVLRELDELDQLQWTSSYGGHYLEGYVLAEKYRAVFRRSGADPGQASADETARWLADSSVRDRLLAALDLWLIREPAVRAVLRTADPDPYRDAYRDARAAGDLARVVELAERPEALTQPPGFAAALGRYGVIPVERQRAVLGAAIWSRPGNPALLMALGETYPYQREWADERVRWFQAAVAARPANAAAHFNLGHAMFIKGDYDGAAAACRNAIRLNPNSEYSHHFLAQSLARRGEPLAALKVLQQGAQVNPDWFTNEQTQFRYDSACFACRAAAGHGKDAPPPSDRPALRKRALDWLTADLAAWTVRQKRFARDRAIRLVIHFMMFRWLTDPEWASVREPAELEKLPLDERVGWAKFWTAVRELRDATAPPETAPPPRAAK
jgi:tetratricopeptide (TPR) repeat protein